MPLGQQDCKNPVCKDSPFGNMRSGLSLNQDQQDQCPLSRSQLGRSAWSLLHTTAAYYPNNPSSEDKSSLLSFLEGFKNLYPCVHCRAHFQKDYQRDPPNKYLDSHEQINIWVCRQHNYVNKMLGKAQFDCQYSKIIQRWKTGCDNGEDGDL